MKSVFTILKYYSLFLSYFYIQFTSISNKVRNISSQLECDQHNDLSEHKWSKKKISTHSFFNTKNFIHTTLLGIFRHFQSKQPNQVNRMCLCVVSWQACKNETSCKEGKKRRHLLKLLLYRQLEIKVYKLTKIISKVHSVDKMMEKNIYNYYNSMLLQQTHHLICIHVFCILLYVSYCMFLCAIIFHKQKISDIGFCVRIIRLLISK